MTGVVWLGDEDPAQQTISQFGYSFVKGEKVTIDAKDKDVLETLKGNPAFSFDAKSDPVKAIEPYLPDPAAGTEKEALKRELRELGVSIQGNPSEDTLRGRLAEALNKASN